MAITTHYRRLPIDPLFSHAPCPLAYASRVLPIESILPDLLAALATSPAVVLEAPPGAGKTTRVPLALLNAPWLGGQKIVMLEPRRLAARAAAARMAQALGERAGETVGYRVRRDTRVSAQTRIEVVTEGVLTRMLQGDPALEGVGVVIFDEYHERSLVADVGLALTLACVELLRPDLRILVMSATLDGVAVARLLGEVPVVRSTGRAFPVETHHRPVPDRVHLEAHVARVVRESLASNDGSVLVFLPGAGEIRRVEALLRDDLPRDVSLHPLHGMLPADAQDVAIAPSVAGHRKVVLATSIAETSLTIEGIGVVVDGGWMRVPRFSSRTGMTRLDTIRVSRASADQRRGRAGRLAPGVAYRCWSVADEIGLVPYSRAEMLDADLAPLALDLAAAGFADPAELRWLDPPPAAAFARARELLLLLGAIDEGGRLTPHGRGLAALGAHPRLGHLLLRAKDLGDGSVARAAALVALLEDRDPMRSVSGPPPADIALRLDAIEGSRDRESHAIGTELDRGGVARLRQAAADWRRRIGVSRSAPDGAADIGLLLAFAYPERVAQRRGAPGRFLLRNGRGASLPIHDALAHVEWLVAAAVDDSGADGRIMLAAAIDPADLLAHASEQVAVVEDISWHDDARSVIARRRTTLGALVLADAPILDPSVSAVRIALEEGIARVGVNGLPWSDGATRLRARLAFLHDLDSAWPDVSDGALLDQLDAWLGTQLNGIRGFDDLSRIDFTAALMELLPWNRRRALDELAPERIEVPSGSRIAIDYGDSAAPVLPVRLQEVFGLTTTPCIGGGRVPLVMHLLSPAYRPVQVTRDLASFWKSGYFDVRKDLRGRYPKHQWPDDPIGAVAVSGVRRRR